MEGEKKSFLKPLLVILAVILFSGLSAAGVWWWQNGEMQKQRTDSNRQISDLQKQVNDLKKTDSTATTTAKPATTQPTDETANWKTYVNSNYKYSLKYPSSLIVREFGGETRVDPMITIFAKTDAEFSGASGSDKPMPIKIYVSEDPNCCSNPQTTQSVVIAGKKSTKYTLLNAMGGEPEIYYVIPYHNSYLIINDHNNYEVVSFNKMIQTLSFY